MKLDEAVTTGYRPPMRQPDTWMVVLIYEVEADDYADAVAGALARQGDLVHVEAERGRIG